MKGKSPLQLLAQAFAGRSAGLDVPAVASQLGLLPDLRYFVDGLHRSLECVRAHGAELEACLRAVPGRRLEPEALVDAIQKLLAWSGQQAWADDDPRVMPMVVVLDPGRDRPDESGAPAAPADMQEATAPGLVREPGGIRHPLAGYCLSVAFHWSNLFYTLEPSAAGQSPEESGAVAYGELMAEFSAYVLAAQSTIDADAYMAFVAEWWASDRLPARPLYPDRRLASRVATASRAMRRLSRLEHRELFGQLADRADGSSLPERVERAIARSWQKDDEGLLRAIDRLFESVQLDRRPAGGAEARRRSGKAASTSTRQPVHNKFRDGYLRIAYQPAILTVDAMESGLRIETLTRTPPTEETLALELVEGMAWDGPEDSEEESSDGTTRGGEHDADDDGEPAGKSRREGARDEARIQLDGQEWMPVQEGSGEGELVALRIGEAGEDDQTGITAHMSNRHVAEHVRRHHMAHGLTRDRLMLPEARAVLEGFGKLPAEAEFREVYVGLAASLALGRPLEGVSPLLIHEGDARPDRLHERIHYYLGSRQWVVPSPPPAWAEMEVTHAEHRQWPQLFLYDRTDFGALLTHYGLDHEGEILKVLTKARLKAARTILSELLPRADATPAQCGGFLFHRLLATSQGDLGIARQITGKDHSHSASVHHYAHYPAPQLWKAYRDAWNPAWTADPRPQAKPDEDDAARGVGAKRVPTIAAVKGLLAGLQGLMADGTAAQRHNAYTAYTLVGLVLSIGMRPVVEPILQNIADLEGHPLLITYLDKARTDYHRRINAIPPSMEAHLVRYADYIAALRRKPLLRGRAPMVFVHIEPETGEPARFQPRHFRELVESFFPLELYAMRRMARTCLRVVHKVDGEDIDAFMGHWLHQMSPHDRLSTYPMRRLHALADGPVEAMLASVGFVPREPVAWA